MPRRLIKQLLYGFFYCAILGVFVFGWYTLFLKPAPSCTDGKLNQGETEIDCDGPCTACAIKKLKPLQVLPLQLFDAGDGRTTVLAEIQNRNITHGATALYYTVKLWNVKNEILFEEQGQSLIYPAETKTVVLPALTVPFNKIFRSEFAIKDTIWEQKELMERPQAGTREVVTKIEKGKAIIEGLVQNNNPYIIRRAIINAVIVDGEGLYVSASRTNIEDIPLLSERAFRIVIPVTEGESKKIDGGRTQVTIEAVR